MAKKEKFECDDCGCYYWVEDRDDFDCPNCEEIEAETTCGFCGNEIEEGKRYCSYECSKADNTEGV